MIKDILMILSGLIGGCLFILIRNHILNRAKEKLIATGQTIKTESFDLAKFMQGMTTLKTGVGWAKDVHDIFNLRKLILISAIIGVIYGYGWFTGRKGAPVHFDMRGKEATIQLNEHYLKIEKDGTANVVDKEGKILKTIRVKDIPELERALRPYGFRLKPIAVVGGSLGEKGAGVEGGVGVSWFKWYKANLDTLLTSRGFYPLGVSYSITDNSGLDLGAEIGYKGDKRALVYYYWKF